MRKYYLLNIIIATVLFLIFYSGVNQDEFLFVHDQYLELSSYGNDAGLLAINPANFGESNVLGLLTNFWDKVLYNLFFRLDISVPWIQRILVFIILNYVLALPLVGFTKIARAFGLPIPRFTLYVVSLFFTFNTYTLFLWNGGHLFSVTLSLAYALVPLAFITFHKAIFGESQFIEKAKSCLLIFIISFATYTFMTFAFFLVVYSIIYIILNHDKYKTYLSNLSLQAALYVPLALVLLVVPGEISSSANSDSIAAGGAYASLQGGLLYQMLMWFSWAIYIHWEPRSILTFYKYYNEPLSIIAPFLLYAVLIYYFIKDRTRNKANNKQILAIFLVLLIMFVFIKGAQAPLGWAYLFLLKYMPLSSVFRSPDMKFALGIIFAIALLFVFLSNKANKSFIASAILIVIAIQCYPLFTGLAVRGEKSQAYRSRIVSISQEYAGLIAYVNTHNEPYGYVLPLPAIAFGYYRHDPAGAEGFIGQDLLPMLSSLPFVYLAEGSISKAAYDQTMRMLKGNSNVPDTVPVKYILLRKDVMDDAGFSMEAKDIPGAFVKVFENSLFDLYNNTKYRSLVHANDMTFAMISPVKYFLSLKNINKEQTLAFLQNYRDSWTLYPAANSARPDDHPGSRFTLEDLSFLWKKSCLVETHSLHNGYANSWKLTPAYIKDRIPPKYYKTNADGSIDLNFILFNRTQSLFYNTALISFGYALILLCIIVIKFMNLRVTGAGVTGATYGNFENDR